MLEKEKGKAIQSQGGNETQRQWRTLSRETKGDWGSEKGMEDTLNIMRRRTRGGKGEWRTLSREAKGDWGSKRGMEDALNIIGMNF